jgi:CBS domain-containing protein
MNQSAELHCLTVRDAMTRHPLCIRADAELTEALAMLASRGVRRAPVIGHSGELIGVISFDDLLAQVAGNLRSLAHMAEVRSWPPRHERRGHARSPSVRWP